MICWALSQPNLQRTTTKLDRRTILAWEWKWLHRNCCRCMLPSIHHNFHWDPTDTIDSRSVCPSPCTKWTHQTGACHHTVYMLVWYHISTRPIVRMASVRHSLAGIAGLQLQFATKKTNDNESKEKEMDECVTQNRFDWFTNKPKFVCEHICIGCNTSNWTNHITEIAQQNRKTVEIP